MAPKFPNPDPATDSVRDRLGQFIEVAGRAVYPPLAVAPSPTTPGQVWWDISDTIKIRDEANEAWASLAATMGAVSFKEAQTLTSGEKAQARTNIDLDFVQKLEDGARMTSPNGIESIRIHNNGDWGGYSDTLGGWRPLSVVRGGTGADDAVNARANLGAAAKLPTAGAVESFIFAYHTDGDVTYGGTYAGANLRATGAANSIYVIGTNFTAQAGLGFIPSGTWVCLGSGVNHSTTPSASSVDFAFLFQRIV